MSFELPAGLRLPAVVRALLRAVADVRRANGREFAMSIALQASGTASAVLVLLGIKEFAGSLAGSGSEGGFAGAVCLLVAGVVTGSGLAAWQPQQLRKLAEDAADLMWRRFVTVTSQLDLSVMETPAVADRLERIQEQALGRPVAVTTSIFGLVGGLTTTVAMGVAAFVIEPLVVPLLLLGAAPGLLAARRGAALEAEFASRTSEQQRFRFYLRLLLSRQQFAREIRSHGAAPALFLRMGEVSRLHRSDLGDHVRRRVLLQWFGATMTAVALGAVLWLLAAEVTSGQLSVAEAAGAAVAIRTAGSGADRLVMSLARLMEAAPFLRDLYDLVDSTPAPPETGARAWPLDVGVRLERVCYRYAGTTRDALSDIDLEIPAGCVVAVVGENGSGKSTLARIVAGLYSPSRGTLRWDGHPVEPEDRPGLRASVGSMLQDFVSYQLTAAENVDLNRSGTAAARARVRDAARHAGIDDVLVGLREGYDTQLGLAFSGGVDLSGGQWQRVALARALHREAPLIVLDEPTSALDPRAERALLGDLRAATAGRTVLVISHRYANLHLVDRIFVLAEGRVVESGSHQELLARGGVYADLYLSQSRGYQVTS